MAPIKQLLQASLLALMVVCALGKICPIDECSRAYFETIDNSTVDYEQCLAAVDTLSTCVKQAFLSDDLCLCHRWDFYFYLGKEAITSERMSCEKRVTGCDSQHKCTRGLTYAILVRDGYNTADCLRNMDQKEKECFVQHFRTMPISEKFLENIVDNFLQILEASKNGCDVGTVYTNCQHYLALGSTDPGHRNATQLKETLRLGEECYMSGAGKYEACSSVMPIIQLTMDAAKEVYMDRFKQLVAGDAVYDSFCAKEDL